MVGRCLRGKKTLFKKKKKSQVPMKLTYSSLTLLEDLVNLWKHIGLIGQSNSDILIFLLCSAFSPVEFKSLVFEEREDILDLCCKYEVHTRFRKLSTKKEWKGSL